MHAGGTATGTFSRIRWRVRGRGENDRESPRPYAGRAERVDQRGARGEGEEGGHRRGERGVSVGCAKRLLHVSDRGTWVPFDVRFAHVLHVGK